MRHYSVRAIVRNRSTHATEDMTFNVWAYDWWPGFLRDHGAEWEFLELISVDEQCPDLVPA